MGFRKGHINKAAIICLIAAAGLFAALFPKGLFKDKPCATVVLADGGELLGAHIADDGQWRFPPCDTVPEKYARALILFEDQYFYYHPGVNPVAIAKALIRNIKAGHIVNGGSTIAMQVMRMAKSQGKSRNVWQKIWESYGALCIGTFYSKRRLLSLYASNAPFGGNVVGIDAAAWRYFGHDASNLSWAESALLAVLPNSPSSIHIARNRKDLTAKRNRLLARLHKKEYISDSDYSLAIDEPLPDEPHALPQLAPHLVDWYYINHRSRKIKTDISFKLQSEVAALTDAWNRQLQQEGINDLAAVVIDVRTGKELVYIGNANPGQSREGARVDILRSPRSTGSILKPFLYCAMLQNGQILPRTLLPDIPMNINGFSPQNFDRTFCGAIPASEALARSLNIPFVHLLQTYGVAPFASLLKDLGMSTVTRSANDYGLSLILGGAEGKLLEITRMYASLPALFLHCRWVPDSFPLKDRVALWWTFDALKEVGRTDEIDWKTLPSVSRIAWKTGTSWGFRDAWAVGVTTDYAVGVWAGNANGSGVSGLVGARIAAPVLFDIFNLLPRSAWFEQPVEDEGIIAEVCHQSGQLKGQYCNDCDTLLLPRRSIQTDACPYHCPIIVNSAASVPTDFNEEESSVNDPGTLSESSEHSGSCSAAQKEYYFKLPPAMEWYYKASHPEYTPVPADAMGNYISGKAMEFIYPQAGSVISIPRQLNGESGGIIFNLAHSDTDMCIFWHLDNNYVGQTRWIHQLQLTPEPGRHTITAVDTLGNSTSVSFTVR